MSREVRSLIFLFFLAAFLFAGPFLVLWSQGYRFDLQSNQITRVGGLFLKAEPPDVIVQITRKPDSRFDKGIALIKNISPTLLYNGTLIKNLLPRTYTVSISSSIQRATWAKKLTVEPLGVTKATHIFLPKKEQKPKALEIATSVVALWPAIPLGKNGADIASAVFQIKNVQSLYAIQLDDNDKKPEELFNFRSLLRTGTIRNILFSAVGKNAIIESENDAVLWLPEKTPKARLASHYLNFLSRESNTPPKSFMYVWHPINPTRFYVIVKNGFYQVDTSRDEFLRVGRAPLLGFGAGNSEVFYLTKDGDLFRLNANTEPFLVLSLNKLDLPLLLESPNAFWVIREAAEGNFLLFNGSGSAYHLDREHISAITKQGEIFSLSADGVKLAFREGTQIWVYAVTRISDDVPLDRKTKIRLKEPSAEPSHLFWLPDNWHILALFDAAGGAELIEMDYREPLNSWQFVLGTMEAPFWDAPQRTLWSVNEGRLIRWKLE